MIEWSKKEAAIKTLQQNGRIDPLALIEAAKKPGHPCHGDFTWDIDKAAQERWRDQSRSLIRRCRFEVVIEEVTIPVVSFVPSLNDENDFVSVVKVRSLSKVSAMMVSELSRLHGVAARVYGIAFAKQGIIGDVIVARLDAVLDEIESIKADVEE